VGSASGPGAARAEGTIAGGGASRYPAYSRAVDGGALGLGAAALALSYMVGDGADPVPDTGLDPADIRWAVDRRVVGHRDDGANALSDWTRDGAIALPAVVAFATAPTGSRADAVRRRAALYGEALLLGQGVVRLGKNAVGRARPFTYLAIDDRPDDAGYDVAADRAFRALPSGHSATAWTAACLAVTENLLTRPYAGRLERLSIGFVGGALAGGTSVLRVEAGQHFPSDVLAGGALGVAIGVGLPLLHRGDLRVPSRGAWLEAAGGLAAGALVAGLAASR